MIQSRRVGPDVDAEFWCKAGLDKDGFEEKYIDDTIGTKKYNMHKYTLFNK